MFSYDATGVEAGMFLIAPEGMYTLVIKTTEEKKTKKNNYDMVACRCEIADGDHKGVTIWHNVTFIPKGEKGAGMAIQFLKAIGEPHEGELDVDSLRWVGKEFTAKVVVGKDLQGRDRNEIAWIAEGTDEVPF